MKTLFFIEVTDTYGGDANYSWLTRHVIKAKNARGAVQKFSRLSGMNWRLDYDCGNCEAKYLSKSGATCYFIQPYDADCHAEYSFNTDER